MADRIDFSKVLDDIAYMLGEPLPGTPLRIPVGTRAVADYLKFNRSTILRWLDGAEPRHSDGQIVLAVWCRLTGKDAAFAPKERAILSAARMR